MGCPSDEATKDRSNLITRNIAFEAAQWIVLLKSPTLKVRRGLLQWLRQSPDHVRELLMVMTLNDALSRIDPERRIDVDQLLASTRDNVIPLSPRNIRSSMAQPAARRPRWVACLGATAVTAVLATLIWLGTEQRLQDAGLMNEQVTAGDFQAEKAQVLGLTDGSSISMRPRSRLSVVLDDHLRAVALDAGGASFNVAHDTTRPFRVRVGRLLLQTTGAKFDVDRSEQLTQVAVSQGRVSVANRLTGLPTHSLEAGDRLRIFDGGAVAAVTGSDVESEVHHIAFLDDVFLAFEPQLARFL